jgi:dUTP pyrophosphatase
MHKIKFIKINNSAIVPSKGSKDAAAYDLYSIDNTWICINEVRKIRTGIIMEIPEGFKGEIYSRSGLASKGIIVANQPGKIDSDYRGEIMVLLSCISKENSPYVIRKGDRIAQFEIQKVEDIIFEE